jgi:3-hydroxyacyl-[acyl-carrier-protein] dehydratase
MSVTPLPVAADHPAYAGHFPGQPVLPAVVLLDATLHAIAGHWEVNSAKFQSAVRPGEELTLHHDLLPNGSVRFAIRTGNRTVASGILVPSRVSAEKNRGEQS